MGKRPSRLLPAEVIEEILGDHDVGLFDPGNHAGVQNIRDLKRDSLPDCRPHLEILALPMKSGCDEVLADKAVLGHLFAAVPRGQRLSIMPASEKEWQFILGLE